MFLAVDVGGTKTLVALFSPEGQVVKENKFETDPLFDDFIAHLIDVIKTQFWSDEVTTIVVGMPGKIDRANGVGVRFGNLDWSNVPIKAALKAQFDTDIYVENDAKLAGLGEAKALPHSPRVALYITISTGIGIGVITDGEINPYLQDSEAGFIQFERDGELTAWEHFASGKAILERYNSMARDIHDEDTWQEIAKDLSLGFMTLIPLFQPTVIIVGGGVGNYLERFHEFLVTELEDHKRPMATIPPIVKAKHPDEAVIYGAYQYAKQRADHK